VLLLWQTGLLRADFLLSDEPVETPGLKLVGQGTSGEYWYADERPPLLSNRGVLDCAKAVAEPAQGIAPYFHTFRVYVLHHLKRLLGVEDQIARMQPLRGADRYAPLVETVLSDIERFTLSDSFSRCIERWHDVAALAILAEPFAAERVFCRLRMPPGRSIAEQRKRIREYGNELFTLFRSVGIDRIEAARNEICREEYLIDSNKDLHNLIRVGLPRMGLRLRADIGLAICFRIMAEAVRRAAEEAFGCDLPEEDECGLGSGDMVRNFKSTVYGGQRILDSDSVTKAFLRQQGLDRGLTVRWYVEGETEYGFLEHVLGIFGTSGIEIINLRGQVAQAKKNILTFRDSLRSDMKLEIFSLVTVDRDVGEVVSAVKAAIAQDEFFGRVFMPQPSQDFEFGNFALDELTEVLCRIAEEQGVEDGARDRLRSVVQGATTSTELMRRASQAVPECRFNKGVAWGRALAIYFLEKGAMPDGSPRPIRKAIEYAYGIQQNQYAWTRNKYKVDAESGRMVPRSRE
jgi:hypothetical protein